MHEIVHRHRRVALTTSDNLSSRNFWGTCRILHLLSIPGNSCAMDYHITVCIPVEYSICDQGQPTDASRSHLHGNDNQTMASNPLVKFTIRSLNGNRLR